MSSGVDTSEIRRLAADLRGMATESLPKARAVVQKACADTTRDAQMWAPVDTGFLRSSIGYETRQSGSSIVGEVGPTAEYGRYVEEGTSRMAPQPYIGPAFDRNSGQFMDAMRRLMDGLI